MGELGPLILHLEAGPIPLEADCMKFQPFLGWRLASIRVRETFELNQLKSTPSQLLSGFFLVFFFHFFHFFQHLTGCKLVAINLDRPISFFFFFFFFFFFEVLPSFFFIVMTTGQELGH
jgi:hypothetical protein